MKNELLFESFPFIIGNAFTFSRLEETDAENLDEIFESTNLAYGALNFIKNSHHAFSLRTSIDLGFYKNDKPNQLIGVITLSHFDYILNSLSINIIFKEESNVNATEALIDLTNYIFNTIDIRRISAELKSPSEVVCEVFEVADFVKEGEIRDCYQINETTLGNIVIYGMLECDRAAKPKEEEISLDFLNESKKATDKEESPTSKPDNEAE